MDKPKFHPLNEEQDNPNNDTTPSEKHNIELAKLQADIDIKKSEASMIIAENNLKQKLAEANIASIEEFVKQREDYSNKRLDLERDKAMVNTKQELLDGLLIKYDDLLASMNAVIQQQEIITTEANEKLALANSKMNNYAELQEKKCADCLRRDKAKCDKCNFKIYSIKYQSDFNKWLKKLER